MRTTLDIPDPLFRHLKARAAMQGSTLRDLVVGFAKFDWLKRPHFVSGDILEINVRLALAI